MPFIPLSKNQRRRVTLVIKGPRTPQQQKRLKKDLLALARKHAVKIKARET